MKKSRLVAAAVALNIKNMFSFLCSLLKVMLQKFGLVFPCETIEEKDYGMNAPNWFEKHAPTNLFLVSLFLFCMLFDTSAHLIMTLDILFFLHLNIPFLFKTYSKYLPSVA